MKNNTLKMLLISSSLFSISSSNFAHSTNLSQSFQLKNLFRNINIGTKNHAGTTKQAFNFKNMSGLGKLTPRYSIKTNARAASSAFSFANIFASPKISYVGAHTLPVMNTRSTSFTARFANMFAAPHVKRAVTPTLPVKNTKSTVSPAARFANMFASANIKRAVAHTSPVTNTKSAVSPAASFANIFAAPHVKHAVTPTLPVKNTKSGVSPAASFANVFASLSPSTQAVKKVEVNHVAAAQQAERARLANAQAARQAERARLANAQAAQQAEQTRLANEQAARQTAAQQAAAQQAERTRLANEQAAAQQAERTRLANEQAAAQQAERTRLANEQATQRAAAERTRLANEQAAQRAAAERTRLANEQAAAQQAEQTRLANEQAARQAAAQQASLNQVRQWFQDLGFNNFTNAQIILFNNPIQKEVLRNIVSDRGNYNRLDSLNKIEIILNSYGNALPDADHILLLARRVNGERFNRDNIAAQIEHVKKATKIIQMNDQDILDDGVYNDAIEARDEVYTYINTKGRDWTNNNDFDVSIREIKTALNLLPNDNFPIAEDLSIRSGLKILDYNEKLENDITALSNKFDLKQFALSEKLRRGEQERLNGQPAPSENNYFIAYDEFNGIAGLIPRVIDLQRDDQNVRAEIDRISRLKVADPLRLNYQRLTYDNFAEAAFDINYTPVTVGEFDLITTEALGLVNDNDFDAPSAINGFRNYANEYRHQINQRFNRLRNNNDLTDKWKERVANMWKSIPQALVDSTIKRPTDANHDPAVWGAALHAEKKNLLQHIVGAVADCNTGVNTKLRIIEDAHVEILGESAGVGVKTKFLSIVSGLIRKLKMDRINELGRNPNINSHEENITAPHLATQRLRLPWGLMGDYQHVIAPRLGYGFDARNNPVQITKNLFLPNQPDRTYEGGARVPVAAPLTVKSLVDAVYNEFDVSITQNHLTIFANSNLEIMKDRLNPIIMGDDGVFVKTGNRTAKQNYTKSMAFYILEKLGYVEIETAAKQALYQYDDNAGEPGTYNYRGGNHNLEEMIDLF